MPENDVGVLERVIQELKSSEHGGGERNSTPCYQRVVDNIVSSCYGSEGIWDKQ